MCPHIIGISLSVKQEIVKEGRNYPIFPTVHLSVVFREIRVKKNVKASMLKMQNRLNLVGLFMF